MIDFVIPSLGRPTIIRSVKSLINQGTMFRPKDPDWKAYVGFDGISEEQIDRNFLFNDKRVTYLFSENKLGVVGDWEEGYSRSNAGFVRNWIISNIKSSNEWIAFLDDDDTVSNYYVDTFYLESQSKKFDCCVFRMRYDAGGEKLIPPLGVNEIIENQVGISFCVNKEFLRKSGVKFVNDIREDYKFLRDLQNAGAKIHISNYVTYHVNSIAYDYIL
ncbi:MAG: glycosyltransferase family A protein [Candidatus Nanopelagicaceae bacterium]